MPRAPGRAASLLRAAVERVPLPRVTAATAVVAAASVPATGCNALKPAATTRPAAQNEPIAIGAAAVPAEAGGAAAAPGPGSAAATACNPVQPRASNGRTNPLGAVSAAPAAEQPGDGLTPRQLAAVRALLGGEPLPAAAARLGVSRQTLWRWSRKPAFVAELRRLHALLAASGAGRAGAGAVAARSCPDQGSLPAAGTIRRAGAF